MRGRRRLVRGPRINRQAMFISPPYRSTPTALGKLLSDPDREKANRVMKAMLQMEKIDVNGLKRAYQETRAAAK